MESEQGRSEVEEEGGGEDEGMDSKAAGLKAALLLPGG